MYKNLLRIFHILSLFLLLTIFISNSYSQGRGDITETRTIDREEELIVEIDFGVGEMFLKSGRGNELYNVDFEYDTDNFRHHFDYRASGRLNLF